MMNIFSRWSTQLGVDDRKSQSDRFCRLCHLPGNTKLRCDRLRDDSNEFRQHVTLLEVIKPNVFWDISIIVVLKIFASLANILMFWKNLLFKTFKCERVNNDSQWPWIMSNKNYINSPFTCEWIFSCVLVSLLQFQVFISFKDMFTLRKLN